MTNNTVVRYELFAENRNGTLIIKNLEQNNYFMTTAQKLLVDKQLLQGFPAADIVRVKLAATFI
jgi:hypothetical protein